MSAGETLITDLGVFRVYSAARGVCTYTREENNVVIEAELVVHHGSDVETSADKEKGECCEYPAYGKHHWPFIVHFGWVGGATLPSVLKGKCALEKTQNCCTYRRAEVQIYIKDQGKWHATQHSRVFTRLQRSGSSTWVVATKLVVSLQTRKDRNRPLMSGDLDI